eukprot:COSAG04_NODE_4533_length_2029_cov_2.022798_4_plen_260_part_01
MSLLLLASAERLWGSDSRAARPEVSRDGAVNDHAAVGEGLDDPDEVAAVVDAGMVPPLQRQPEALQHRDHPFAFGAVHHSREGLLDIHPPAEVLRHAAANQAELRREHRPEVPVAAGHEDHAVALRPLDRDPVPTQPGRVRGQRLAKQRRVVDPRLLYPRQLRAERRQLRVVHRPAVQLELVHDLHRPRVDEDRRQLDDLLRRHPPGLLDARRLKVQDAEIVVGLDRADRADAPDAEFPLHGLHLRVHAGGGRLGVNLRA